MSLGSLQEVRLVYPKVRREVPFYTQYDEEIEESWREKSCGIVALRMAIEGVGGTPTSSSKLLRLGRNVDAYNEEVGWRHSGLVYLAQLHRLSGSREDLKEKDFSEATQILMDLLVVGVPIISIHNEGRPGTHLVPIVGFETQNGVGEFRYHDPEKFSATEGAYLPMSMQELKHRWRRLLICIYNPKEHPTRA